MAPMIRAGCALVLLFSTQASRIQEHDVQADNARTKFGATCEDLQNTFHERVVAIHGSLDGIDDTSELGVIARTRLMMRMHGIIRTLRRARQCSWVMENNSDDLVDMREIVQRFLAENPCAEAAKVEMAGASDENPEGIARAMGILMSDNCEVTSQGAVEVTPEDLEDEVQATFEELAANSDEGAFLEIDKAQRHQFLSRLLRGVGVLFLMLILVFTCAWTSFFLGWFLGIALVVVLQSLGVNTGDHMGSLLVPGGYHVPGRSAGLALVVAVPTCIYQLFKNLVVPTLQ